MSTTGWFTITAAGGGRPADIFIFDQIDAAGAESIGRQLAALAPDQDLTLRINSPGGDAYAGLAIYSLFAAREGVVTAYVDGIAASAASLVMMAADVIIAPENTLVGVHSPWTVAVGTAVDLRNAADNLDKATQSFAATYAKRARQSIAAVKTLMDQNILMSAIEAKQLGYVDRVTPVAELAATFDFNKLPAKHRAMAEAAFSPLASWRRANAAARADLGIGARPR
jgi:ATP-dependent Clp endopeptidase proteolytic subunit ClpP